MDMKVEYEFVVAAETAPTPSCHASTIALSGGRLVAAWFAGTHEKHSDVGIRVSRRTSAGWSAPVEVADGGGVACWNPVLFQPTGGPLLLIYKVGAEIRDWQSWLVASTDHGETWSEPRPLGNGLAGPVKNKPVELADGVILAGTSDEPSWREWRVFFSRSSDGGARWETVGPVSEPAEFQAIQPALLVHGDRIQALCRTREDVLAETWSTDGGRTWSRLEATTLRNPNSGIDAVTLDDGRHLLVYNDTVKGRSPLNVAISNDGRTWREVTRLEEDDGGEYSYPAVIQSGDGAVHITWTHNRTSIRYARIDQLAE